MKKPLKLLSLVTCIILLAAGCATVKENENAEEKEKNSIVIDYGTFKKTAEFNHLGDTIWSYEGDETAIMNHIFGYDNLSLEEIRALHNNSKNKNCATKVSVFPNPTSNFVTLDFDYWKGYDAPPNTSIHFRYELIFDQKVIYKDDIPHQKA